MRIPDHVRGKLYILIPAVGALLAWYKIADEREIDLWIGLVFALLGGGNLLAAAYTPQVKDRSSTPAAKPQTTQASGVPGWDYPAAAPVPPAANVLAAAVDLAKQLGDLSHADAKAVSIPLPDGRSARVQLSITPDRAP